MESSYEAALSVYEAFAVGGEAYGRRVCLRGGKPGGITGHEIPGLHQGSIDPAGRIAEAGLSAYPPVGRFALADARMIAFLKARAA